MKFLKEKTGSISIFVLLLLSFMVGFLLFFLAETSNYYFLKNKYQSINNHIASAAVSNLDNELLRQGLIWIDEDKAQEQAEKMLKESYRLDDNLSIKRNYLLKSDPVFSIYVINDYSGGEIFTTDEGYDIPIYNPSVVIYTKCQPTGIFFNLTLDIQSITIQEVKFDNSGTSLVVPSTPEPADINLYIDNVVNPYRFTTTHPFVELQWSFPPVPMTAGGDVTISANINDAKVNIDTVSTVVQISGVNPDETLYNNTQTIEMAHDEESTLENKYAATFKIPQDCPLGAEVQIKIEALGTDVADMSSPYNLYFPNQLETTKIGTVENNIEELLRFNKR